MADSKITLIGFYNYFSNINDDLFKNMSLPDGIVKDTLVNTILMRGGEFELLYSNPVFMQTSIDIWSKKWFWTFDKWIKAINIEYSPLENYDRREDWTDSSTGHRENSTEVEGTTTDTSSNTSSSASENKVSAFDSDTYEPSDNNTSSAQSANNSTTNLNSTNDGTEDSTSSSTHTGRLHGNIGVTTSQQMLQSELDIARFNLYDQIADIFLQEYVLPVY